MNVAKTIEEIRGLVAGCRGGSEATPKGPAATFNAKTVGIVPTMGALHEGHLSLIGAAGKECDFVVVSIFVNPTQFSPGEDLSTYPRTGDADLAACEKHGVDAVFMPSVETMYAHESLTEITVPQLSQTLCGQNRPTHFTGVCTVVAKLFNIVMPDRAYFGAKDFQQAVIIRRMAADLNFPVEIITCPIVRESDGLAMSSRNAYLTGEQRKQAAALIGSLRMAREMIEQSQPPAGEAITAIWDYVAANAPSGQIDYVRIVDPSSLRDVENIEGSVLIALAVKFGEARFIDNMLVDATGGKT